LKIGLILSKALAQSMVVRAPVAVVKTAAAETIILANIHTKYL
jgi:hypothetical protein